MRRRRASQGSQANGALLAGTADEIAARLVDQPSSTGKCTGSYIDTTDPEASILLMKVSPLHAAACPDGLRMPTIPPVLNPEELACLTAWVHSFAAAQP